ncbi:MAG: DUF3638 domain-containing protein, partial [Verrucomicrobia bacterium]|nr:DUF3638 domain-containing protein [Verrucomicrobiota bacterium]
TPQVEPTERFSFQTLSTHTPGVAGFDIKKELITRIAERIEPRFFAIYKLARTGTQEEKTWLQKALTFASPPTEWTHLVQCVLDNPDAFTQAPLKEDKTWWKELLETADSIGLKPIPEPRKEVAELKAFAQAETVASEPFPLHAAYRNFTKVETLQQQSSAKKCFSRLETSDVAPPGLTAWLESEKSQPTSSEPLYVEAVSQLGKESRAFGKSQVKTTYELQKGGLERLEKLLKLDAKEKLATLEREIYDMANCLPTSKEERLRYQIALQAGTEKAITLDELLIYFGRKDSSRLIKRNAVLDLKKTEALFAHVGEYLILATHEQQRARGLKELQAYKEYTSDAEKTEQLQLLASTVEATRHYTPEEYPAYLVFEYYADMLLREAQVKKLDAFLQSGDKNHICEMIMGSGKSKVLMPLLGLLRADGKTLSTLIVPHALLENVSSDVQEKLWPFAQSLRTLDFTRNTLFSKASLQTILDDLESAKKKRECLIVTNKSIQCLVLKFIEKCQDCLPKNEFPDELMLMVEILSLLHNSSYPLIDEADTVLNVLHEVCFSFGKKVSANPKEIKLISKLYSLLYTDPELKKLARLDSSPEANKKAPVLTEALYHEKIKPALAKKFLASLGVESQEALDYLTRNSKTVPAAMAFFNRQPEAMQNVLALAAEEISSFLPHTLSRICDVKYGLDEESLLPIAIPFAAATVPNVGSQFAKAHITMNYTYQYYAKHEISKASIVDQIERLQSQVMQELRADPSKKIEETAGWNTFSKLRGSSSLPLFNYKEKEIEMLLAHINSSITSRLEFVTNVILPQLELFTHKISCNGHNLISLFLIVLGFTGTLWNSKSMSSRLTPQPEPGTDIKTLGLLWQHSRGAVYTIDEASPDAMLGQLAAQGVTYDMISDAGGYFKEGGNSAIAALMTKRNGKPTLFYNKNNEQVMTDAVTEVPVAESKTAIKDRNTFLGQIHTTGADAPQKIDAVAAVTIGKNMLLRDLLQAVWRLRGLDKSQRVRFVITKDVESMIREKVKKPGGKLLFEDILRYVLLNQVEQQAKDNFKGFRQEVEDHFQMLLLMTLIKPEFTPAQKCKAYSVLSEHWVKPALLPPKDLYGQITTEEDAGKVLAAEVDKFNEKLDIVYRELPFLEKTVSKAETKKAVELLVQSLSASLPAKLNVPLRDADSDQTVEIEQEEQQERETALEVHEAAAREKVTLGLCEADTFYQATKMDKTIFEPKEKKKASLPMALYTAHDPLFKLLRKAFDGISLSINVLEWPKENPRVKDLQLLGNNRNPFDHILVGANDEVTLLSQKDATKVGSKELYTLSTGFYKKRALSKKLQERITKVKFLNGESTYTRDELAILQAWMKKYDLKTMQKFYEERIISGYPEKALRYSQSNLRTLFHASNVTRQAVR